MGKMNKNVIAKMHRILLTTDTEKNSALSGPATVVLAPQAYICRAMCHGAILRWIGTRRADLFWPRPLWAVTTTRKKMSAHVGLSKRAYRSADKSKLGKGTGIEANRAVFWTAPT